jgi:hypothetical protein
MKAYLPLKVTPVAKSSLPLNLGVLTFVMSYNSDLVGNLLFKD